MLTDEGVPFIPLSVLIRPIGSGQMYLVAELNLRDVWDLVDDISFGQSGHAFLASENGVLIAHPDKTLVLGSTEELSTGTIDYIHPRQERHFTTRGGSSQALLVATAPLRFVDWTVVMQQNLVEAFLSLNAILIQSAVSFSIIAATAILASLYLSSQFSSPLNRLLAGTNRIRGGELGFRIDISKMDEIGALSKSFNNMVEDLQAWSNRLTESEERHRLLTENANDIIFSVSQEGYILHINNKAESIVGYTPEDLVGRRARDLFDLPVEEGIGDNELEEKGELEVEVAIKTKNGKQVVLEVKLVRVLDPWIGVQYYGVARDITERKQAVAKLLSYQSQLQNLASQLSTAEAKERKRIATDIHDRIGQGLALARIRLATLKTKANSSQIERIASETMESIDQIIQDTRSLMFNISSPLLYEVGLEAALERLSEQFQSEHEMSFSFTAHGKSQKLETDRAVLLYDVAKELLVNAVKHSLAINIKVTLESNDSCVTITVEDDGQGIGEKVPFLQGGTSNGGFGLFSIRERIQHIGGDVEIESDRGKGTLITVRVPLEKGRIYEN